MAVADYSLEYIKIAPATETDASGYYQCDSTVDGALQVIADSATLAEGKIKLSSVTPYKSKKTLEVGDYVVEKTIAVGAYVPFDSLKNEDFFKVSAIPKDSFSYNDAAPTENNIEIEDSDDYFATIKTDAGTRGFTLQSYDMGADAYKYLMGFSKSGDWYEEAVSFELQNQCVEIKTKALDGFPAKIYQYARMSVKVNRTGTIGKSGFPTFNLEFTKLANYNANGDEIPGFRWTNPS